MRAPCLALILLLPASLRAEVYLCGTVWRSAPCQQAKGSQLERPRPQTADVEKQEIVLKLERYAELVAAELNHHDFEAEGVSGFCLRADVSVEECRARALKADRALTSFYQSSLKIVHRKRELAQREDELALKRERVIRSAAIPKIKRSRRH